MASEGTPAALRERAAREDMVRRRRLSIRLGSAGLVLLFLGAIGTVLYPDAVVGLLGVMVAGFVLVLAAFLVVRSVSGASLRLGDLTKMP